MTKGKQKHRNFTFLIYPDSAPDDWQLRLESLGLAMAISPLHDKDKREISDKDLSFDETIAINNGEILYKKAHYHVLSIEKNPVTADAVRKRIQRKLGDNAVNKVQIVDNVKGMYDYLTHDSVDAVAKNKHKYNKADLVLLNNFDIDRYITLDSADKKDVLKTIRQLIIKYELKNIIEFWSFYFEQAEALDLPSEDAVETVIKENTGYLRLHFDGVYQMSKDKR